MSRFVFLKLIKSSFNTRNDFQTKPFLMIIYFIVNRTKNRKGCSKFDDFRTNQSRRRELFFKKMNERACERTNETIIFFEIKRIETLSRNLVFDICWSFAHECTMLRG